MNIHFIGIGGIGVSALARYYKLAGNIVSGSDIVESEITQGLQKEGIRVIISPQKEENINKDIDFVIYSAAIENDNPELRQARKLKIKIKKYSDALGDIAKNYYTICIAGTHGKSTTTAMLALVLIKAGLDPTIIVGTKLKELNDTNFRQGSLKSHKNFSKPIILVEADEWNASFLSYTPDIIAITNIEKEHLDFYRDFDHIIDTYKRFVNKIRNNGVLILSKNDPGSQILLANLKNNNIKKEFYDNLEGSNRRTPRHYVGRTLTEDIKKILKVPGEHNIKNALVVRAVAQELFIDEKDILSGLSKYSGSWRRFEERELKINKLKKIKIINDYAHHPTEIKATISAAREKYSKKILWAIFQPHQKQRTHYLFTELTECFDGLDHLILTNIYEVKGREDIKIKISSRSLAKAIQKHWQKHNLKEKTITYIANFNEIVGYIKDNINDNAVLLIMGAGNVYDIDNLLA
ncbi:UDP-N-acetylmuramate--L-alanine ligase [bacterium]|nr:MAG: UDP-N-acetylmuramate--L-alanine ligase [bacterium]